MKTNIPAEVSYDIKTEQNLQPQGDNDGGVNLEEQTSNTKKVKTK